ncbi:MAG: RNA polymerase sigma factor [Planctomycetes bacterium]|nr:RNA polymerase sigma factor [Planctomycetota bacterium]
MDPDQELAAGLARRELGALHATYERHGERVQRLCLRLLGRSADAEDAAQEVFLRLFERAASFDGRARFSTWLHRLTVNLCLHRLEKERRRVGRSLPDADELVDPGAAPDAELGRTEARETLARLLARLSGEHRAILVLRELEGLSYAEIAATLELPVGTVMSRLARARGELVRLAGARPSDEACPIPHPIPEPT